MIHLIFLLASSIQTAHPLALAEKTSVIAEFSKEFQAHYVFPDVATKAVQVLQQNLSAHKYDEIPSAEEFVNTLNHDLNDVCKDAHLHLTYSAEQLPVRQNNEVPSPIEIEQERKRNIQLNGGVEHVERLSGNIGYLEIRGFLDPKAAVRPVQAAFEFLTNTDALILDLRRNGGGDPATVQLVCSYLFGPKPVHLNDLYFREGNKTFQSWTFKKVKGSRYENKPVFVLVSRRTGSGAEECAYDLQSLKRATIIGERTWGGANPGDDVRLDDHFLAFIPGGRAINPYTHTNWEGTGVTPDVKIDPTKSLVEAQKLALKQILSTASDPDDKQRLQAALDALEK